MSFRRYMKGNDATKVLAEGFLSHDLDALSDYQRECIKRLEITIQTEQEAYFIRHPEISAMLKIFLSDINREQKECTLKKFQHFVRPAEELDKEVRQILNLPPDVPYTYNKEKEWIYEDLDLIPDLNNIVKKFYPAEPLSVPSIEVPTPNTVSSSFLSLRTSASTQPTPERVPTPPLTFYEIMYNMISLQVDKATFAGVTDDMLKYDTAYVELMKAVEVAMEIPVIEIREDIAMLLHMAYYLFEKILDEKDRIAAEIAWEKRMRKKLKRTLRRQKNFKGYETPPTPKSVLSSHESYKRPPPRPCVCHPPFTYNRYPKDRFGIYIPRETDFSNENVTVVEFPADKSLEHDEDDNDAVGKKSECTLKSCATGKSGATTKSDATTKSGATTRSDVTTKSDATTASKGVPKRGAVFKIE